MKRIAIIPARGGSKRIKNKNIVDFCGQPLIAHSLAAARESGLFDKIHVSTDDAAIAETVGRLGYPVEFMRAPELADDFTPLMPVLKWVLEEFKRKGETYDEVCLLMPTAPLLTAALLRGGHEVFRKYDGEKALLAVCQYPVPVEWAFSRSPDGALTPREPGKFAVRSQDLEPKYYDTGTFVFYGARKILAGEAGTDSNYVSYVIPKECAVDIDTQEDLDLAAALYRGTHARR